MDNNMIWVNFECNECHECKGTMYIPADRINNQYCPNCGEVLIYINKDNREDFSENY
jgi:predicted RNA-binding Zn-ribbon protein involved in translation (DUF1610 family)